MSGERTNEIDILNARANGCQMARLPRFRLDHTPNPEPLTRVRVEVREPAVEHSLTVQQLKRWAERTPISPAERIKKERLKVLLAP